MNKIFTNAFHILKKNLFFYPILFGIYPVLALWAHNFEEIKPEAVFYAFLFSLIGGILVFFVIKLILKDTSKSSLLFLLLAALFYSYGHVYDLLEGRVLFGFVIGRHKVLAITWAILSIILGWLILRFGSRLFELNRIISWLVVSLFAITVLQLGYYQFRPPLSPNNSSPATQNSINLATTTSDSPDIYYILLDAYAREDVLNEVYHFDNRDFLNQLRGLGFVIPDCTQSNYTMTALSMSSTLNMNYLESYDTNVDQSSTSPDVGILKEYIRYSQVRKNFSKLGYKMVTFETANSWLNISDSDFYIQEENPLFAVNKSFQISDFAALFLRTTAFRLLLEGNNIVPAINQLNLSIQKLLTPSKDNLQPKVLTPGEIKYKRLLFNLSQMDEITSIPGRKFVYAHIDAPHHPFVVDPNGSYDLEQKDDPGYTNQVAYLNTRILPIIKKILANSKTPPIIIVQGDHGWLLNKEYHLKILNAYYLPNGGNKLIYPTISPVNTFRIIFNYYFGGNYPVLEDVYNYSVNPTPYQFERLPVSCVDNSTK